MENNEVAADLAMILSETISEPTPVIYDCIVSLIDLANKLYKQYPKKRIVLLALCHKKAKVRKKNRSRIAKYYKSHKLDWSEINEN